MNGHPTTGRGQRVLPARLKGSYKALERTGRGLKAVDGLGRRMNRRGVGHFASRALGSADETAEGFLESWMNAGRSVKQIRVRSKLGRSRRSDGGGELEGEASNDSLLSLALCKA
jgi:hypothetical protein